MANNGDKIPVITTLLGTLITGLLAFNTYKVSSFENKLKQVESEREVNFRIYTSLSEAVESSNPKRIRAVRVLVESLASEDLKEGFLEALEIGEIEIYQSEEVLVERSRKPTPQVESIGDTDFDFDWGDWDYDVFWCSGSGSGAEALANALVENLIKDGAKGRIRSRILPASVKAQSAYSDLFGYEIRYENNELRQAQALKDFAVNTTGIEFSLNNINPNNKTAWYISAFICPKT